MMSLGDPGCCQVKSWFVCNSDVLRRGLTSHPGTGGVRYTRTSRLGMTIAQPNLVEANELNEPDWREELADFH